jgi:exodeoxyribonuclease VII large subunit
MERQPISVSNLAEYIKRIFDAETLLYNIEVIGEISSFGLSNGNAFFTIKDDKALLNCVLFGICGGYQPKVGEKVVVMGTPKYYVKGGKLNFNAISIKPFGEGDIFKRFLELKNRLEKEGLFDVAHKKTMPSKIERIGVVTSETGAVIHDIINIARRRNASQDIVLYPIKVQGIGADKEIAKGIDFFSNYANVDAVIVGRGGGSDEDLQCFNSEIVARAVYNCKKFIVSAVGHETDTTLCDYSADLRAPTPSAAAELLTRDRSDQKSKLKLLMQNIQNGMQYKLVSSSNNLHALMDNINNEMQNYLFKKQKQFDLLGEMLKNCNPKAILNKGYAKIESNGQSIASANRLSVGQDVNIYFADGMAIAGVKEVK